MARHNKSAFKIAQFLENHAEVERVNYPGLETNLYNKSAKELFDGFSGMLSFELKGGLESANNFLKKVTLSVIAPSLGGVESLITLPATTSHSGMSPEERQRVGISDSLVRMSVGIEDGDDLIADLEKALS